ncbi:type IV pilus twitching motility protein PilT [Oceanirhabdus seepicola]|uniref:Type IV pilus twitching motility protein PilT n=1 Tax=Oceanirhabdus seepicola TaxID=2828781 RepID=A0A9J6P5X5_9CLOT|nr:type IV pilus twitching motility protein PilT [Oceanirhabdus seepicola]MCM1990880.1 type IV pilus twitching motility protein PilT [Oceanirhabdus seepicola]
MIPLKELLENTIQCNASDLHLTVGASPNVRVDGELQRLNYKKLMPLDTEEYAKEILEEKFDEYMEMGEYDISFSLAGLGRFRVNVYKQRGSHAIAIRVVGQKIPSLKELSMPKALKELSEQQRGLVLVTGPTGSGKSTTLAALVNEINNNRSAHIITLEDPIEYLHKHSKSIVNQREIGKDSTSYNRALRAILREDPDVILVGEMRDLETISIALTAAETGHLVLSTLHTVGTVKTIDRIIDVFPPHQQQQIKVQLAAVLKGVVSQQLIPSTEGNGRICAQEIMKNTNAIQNLIREGKTHQIESLIQTGSKYDMKTMDMCLADLCKKGVISKEDAIKFSIDQAMLNRLLVF